MSLIDKFIIVNPIDPSWKQIYKVAQEDREHELWENYQNIDLRTYEHMIVNVRDAVPAAFHGIYNHGRWPENVSRFCNRAYINPYFRNLGQGLEITGKNIKFVLDNYNMWGKDVLFISRGVQYDNPHISWKKFEKFCRFIEKSTGYKLSYDNQLYQCCPKECKDCYQFCVWFDPKNIRTTLDIKNISIEDWRCLA
jgi:hypothetical protein